jgi:hypothetical protein
MCEIRKFVTTYHLCKNFLELAQRLRANRHVVLSLVGKQVFEPKGCIIPVYKETMLNTCQR